MYGEMIKPKNHCFSKMFDMQTILVLDQKLIKVLVFFFLTSISWIHQNSEFREFVNNSLTNKFCCHVLYHVKHKLKQLTKKHKISVQQRIISPQMKYVSRPVFADSEIQVNSPFFVIKFLEQVFC